MDIHDALEHLGRGRGGLATAADLHRAGISKGSLSRATQAGVVVRVRRGVYAAGPLPPWPVHVVTSRGVDPAYVVHVHAALLSLGSGACAAGTTAACLRGWGLVREPYRRLCAAVPHGRSRTRAEGVRIVQRRARERVLLRVHGQDESLPVVPALATLIECCGELPLLEAVAACDSALRAGDLSLAQLSRAAADLQGVRQARTFRRVVELCDPECGSVLESVLRVLMVRAGIGGFTSQEVLHDDRGRRLLRVDFCFRAARLVVEVDGARWHQDPARDRSLDNRLVASGWRVLRFTWSDVLHDSRTVLDLIATAVAAGTGNFHHERLRHPAAA